MADRENINKIFVEGQAADFLNGVQPSFYSSREERERFFPVKKSIDSGQRRKSVRRLLLADAALLVLALVVSLPRLKPAAKNFAQLEHRLRITNLAETSQVQLFLQGRLEHEPFLEIRAELGGSSQTIKSSIADVEQGSWLTFVFPRQPPGQVARINIRHSGQSLSLIGVVDDVGTSWPNLAPATAQ